MIQESQFESSIDASEFKDQLKVLALQKSVYRRELIFKSVWSYLGKVPSMDDLSNVMVQPPTMTAPCTIFYKDQKIGTLSENVESGAKGCIHTTTFVPY